MSKFLDHASKEYYEGNPVISDSEFDILAQRLHYNKVGHNTSPRHAHFYSMSSLQKCFDITESPFELKNAVMTPKLDGAAVSLLYLNGEFTSALTRGDGEYGLDITEKMATLVPCHVGGGNVVQISGEVLAKKSIPNARNYAAGALNLKSTKEFGTRELVFVAYDLRPSVCINWTDDIMCLAISGFNVVTTFDVGEYPTDGEVYRINNNAMYKLAGETAHHPKGSFALKEQKEGVPTRLLDVKWQVGKSGVVSPVGILEPVLIGDAVVTKATLHNIEYIEGLNLEIGCLVEVIRSGEIIPRILRRLPEC